MEFNHDFSLVPGESVGRPHSKPQAKWNNFFCVLPTNCYHLLEIKDNNHVYEWGDVSSGSCYHRTTLPEVSSLVGDRDAATFRAGNTEWLVNHGKRKEFRSSRFFTHFIKILGLSAIYADQLVPGIVKSYNNYWDKKIFCEDSIYSSGSRI